MTEREEMRRRREEWEEREELIRLEELAKNITDSEDENKEEGGCDESEEQNCKKIENLEKEEYQSEETTQSDVEEYCVVCQAGHAMAPSCLTCRACGAPGHLARDCTPDRVVRAEPVTMDETARVDEVIVVDRGQKVLNLSISFFLFKLDLSNEKRVNFVTKLKKVSKLSVFFYIKYNLCNLKLDCLN